MADRESGERVPQGAQDEARTGGTQAGGGPAAADMAAPGGSSGTGGYGDAQNQQFHQGQQDDSAGRRSDPGQSRGERFDEQQGGGRDADSVSLDRDETERAGHEERDRDPAEEEVDDG